MHDLFAAVDTALQSGSGADALEMLAQEFRANGRYDLLFEARGMRKRMELGLPLIQTEASSSFPADVRPAYEEAMIAAAREAGELHLAAGNIAAGYRYFRAIGDLAPVADAIGRYEPHDDVEDVIAIAFQYGVHPAKGLELILHHHGMCRAITAFGMHAVETDREECFALLVQALHAELVERMRSAIEAQEGTSPAATSLLDLMDGRDWLFGEWDYFVDTSHLTSLIPYCLQINRVETLRLIAEFCDYGCRLSPNFAFRAQPPFESGYVDYGHYAKALLGGDVDEHLNHFRAKAAEDAETGPEAAEVLVALLSRLHRYDEALEVFSKYLDAEDPTSLRCPGALQLCYQASDYERLRDTAQQRGDILTYTAARMMSS